MSTEARLRAFLAVAGVAAVTTAAEHVLPPLATVLRRYPDIDFTGAGQGTGGCRTGAAAPRQVPWQGCETKCLERG